MKRLASTRSEKRASQPCEGRAQCKVGSIEDDGIRYGLATSASSASTTRTAIAIVPIHSTARRVGRGRVLIHSTLLVKQEEAATARSPASVDHPVSAPA